MSNSSAESTGAEAGADWSIEPVIPDSVRSVIVFGGAFDPPHVGHIELPIEARERTQADWLLYVPAATPPLKDAQPSASTQDRLAMLRLALQDTKGASVTGVEIARGGVSYTIDTLKALQRRLSTNVSLRLLIGADQAAAFHRWRSFREVIEIAEPIVMLRSPVQTSDELVESLGDRWSDAELERWRGWAIKLNPCQANSTRVRQLLDENGTKSAEIQRNVPTEVLRYIEERSLYR
jgi:nicotinate-nucleotide adenylyltransferase